jgi:metal-sulfur cluster biosynthetic enzyme
VDRAAHSAACEQAADRFLEVRPHAHGRRAGEPVVEGGGHEARLEDVPTREDVKEALRQVEDPELGMDIVDLGLLYDVEVAGPRVKVVYSLTSMGCPAGPLIEQDIERVLNELPDVEDVQTELTFDPPWTPEKMSEDAKFILGIG